MHLGPESITILKLKCYHFDEIFIIGYTGGCYSNMLWCKQWVRFRQNDDIPVSIDLKAAATDCVNPWWSIQNGHRFADDILKLIFLYENCCILIKISMKFQ